MALHNEVEFENEVCEHLAAQGWLYAEKDAEQSFESELADPSRFTPTLASLNPRLENSCSAVPTLFGESNLRV